MTAVSMSWRELPTRLSGMTSNSMNTGIVLCWMMIALYSSTYWRSNDCCSQAGNGSIVSDVNSFRIWYTSGLSST